MNKLVLTTILSGYGTGVLLMFGLLMADKGVYNTFYEIANPYIEIVLIIAIIGGILTMISVYIISFIDGENQYCSVCEEYIHE